MPVPLVQQITDIAGDVQQAAAQIGTTLNQFNYAPQAKTTTPTSSTDPLSGLLSGFKGTLSDVHNAAQLKELLPVVIAVIGILAGKAALGLLLGAAVYFYGQPAAAPAPSSSA